jgi:hypothetical protein
VQAFFAIRAAACCELFFRSQQPRRECERAAPSSPGHELRFSYTTHDWSEGDSKRLDLVTRGATSRNNLAITIIYTAPVNSIHAKSTTAKPPPSGR